MPNTVPNVHLLQASVDPEDTSEFRVLIDSKFIKYLTIDPGIYAADDMCFGPSLTSLLPTLPPGDWNEGHVSSDSATGRPHFSKVTKVQLPQVTHLWHPLQIDYLELCIGKKLHSNVYEAKSPLFDSTVVAKFACFPWEVSYFDSETSAYQWIEGHQIGPRFLAHLSEHGRVIGFIMERMTNSRHASLEDLFLCRQALSKLHQLGIKHGDINKHNVLIHDGKATLIDFDTARRCNDTQALDEEFRRLQEELQDDSGRGGRIVSNQG